MRRILFCLLVIILHGNGEHSPVVQRMIQVGPPMFGYRNMTEQRPYVPLPEYSKPRVHISKWTRGDDSGNRADVDHGFRGNMLATKMRIKRSRSKRSTNFFPSETGFDDYAHNYFRRRNPYVMSEVPNYQLKPKKGKIYGIMLGIAGANRHYKNGIETIKYSDVDKRNGYSYYKQRQDIIKERPSEQKLIQNVHKIYNSSIHVYYNFNLLSPRDTSHQINPRSLSNENKVIHEKPVTVIVNYDKKDNLHPNSGYGTRNYNYGSNFINRIKELNFDIIPKHFYPIKQINLKSNKYRGKHNRNEENINFKSNVEKLNNFDIERSHEHHDIINTKFYPNIGGDMKLYNDGLNFTNQIKELNFDIFPKHLYPINQSVIISRNQYRGRQSEEKNLNLNKSYVEIINKSYAAWPHKYNDKKHHVYLNNLSDSTKNFNDDFKLSHRIQELNTDIIFRHFYPIQNTGVKSKNHYEGKQNQEEKNVYFNISNIQILNKSTTERPHKHYDNKNNFKQNNSFFDASHSNDSSNLIDRVKKLNSDIIPQHFYPIIEQMNAKFKNHYEDKQYREEIVNHNKSNVDISKTINIEMPSKHKSNIVNKLRDLIIHNISDEESDESQENETVANVRPDFNTLLNEFPNNYTKNNPLTINRTLLINLFKNDTFAPQTAHDLKKNRTLVEKEGNPNGILLQMVSDEDVDDKESGTIKRSLNIGDFDEPVERRRRKRSSLIRQRYNLEKSQNQQQRRWYSELIKKDNPPPPQPTDPKEEIVSALARLASGFVETRRSKTKQVVINDPNLGPAGPYVSPEPSTLPPCCTPPPPPPPPAKAPSLNMTGDHMNIYPEAPEWNYPEANVVTYRPWWYYNQDDFQEFGPVIPDYVDRV